MVKIKRPRFLNLILTFLVAYANNFNRIFSARFFIDDKIICVGLNEKLIGLKAMGEVLKIVVGF